EEDQVGGREARGHLEPGGRVHVPDRDVVARADEREDVDGEAVELDGPPGDERAAGVQGAVVVERVDATRAARRGECGCQYRARVQARHRGRRALVVREELAGVARRLVDLVRLD